MDAYFARQPIMDGNLALVGYELLFRPNLTGTEAGETVFIDGNRATSTVLDAVNWDDMDKITGGKLAFVNFTEELLLQQTPSFYPNKYLVVEVLENIELTESVVDAIKSLKSKGYKIAMDDYWYRPEDRPLLAICDFVKCEVDGSPKSYRNIQAVAKAVNLRKCRIIAEKVETEEIFEQTQQLGCTLFQGFFFARPKVIASKIISPLKINQLRLLSEVNNKNSDFDKLAGIIKNDIALTYKTLRLVNSAYFGLQHEITGVNQAVAFLGLHQMKRWLTVSSLSTLSEEKPPELMVMSLVRAHFCEQVAKKTRRGRDAEAYFLAGLFSLLDTLTDSDFETCLKKTTMPGITRRALLEDGNPGRTMLDLIVALEYGSWTWVENYSEMLGLNPEKVSDIYMAALNAAHSLL